MAIVIVLRIPMLWMGRRKCGRWFTLDDEGGQDCVIGGVGAMVVAWNQEGSCIDIDDVRGSVGIAVAVAAELSVAVAVAVVTSAVA